ncbi:MAG: c-type cytochrome [Proteobacteria bacterium]|nr:c-type cytochrome [Pseudomonadota bacterium]
MPAYLTDEILTVAQIDDVTEYVLSLSGKAEDMAKVARGKPHFAEHCAACHKPDGSGNPELGAPPLNNNLWLYGGERAVIKQMISRPRKGVMPAWGPLLQPVTIKKLAIYIHSLGGGQ